MSSNITQIRKEYEDKLKEIKALMKNPSSDSATFSNDTDFRDKHLHFSNAGGTETSTNTVVLNYPIKGYPYKRGVKLSFESDYEPHVEAGGGDDLFGICNDIDDCTHTTTVIPITESFNGYLVVKKDGQASISAGNKLAFNSNGELEKASSSNNTKVNAIALSKAHKINENLYIIHTNVFGNRALRGS
ncbi:DUF228 domain-containing protein (plasmid) [Borrelia miyamotoi]|uniref:DUF228 domain-containing protein n=2 Tax=Borrelia miyamotoi TaxID=47466 RepID=A0AAQ3HFQ8_9SPIR|nr:DUF228 domain-containing protein [Borrelia miyamotoi]AHH05570.1 Hypothetical protein BOM_1027 [Borrelia miyamotoi FR64b]ATQ15299.1 DUF228 domain-containing protein [Borrelia miyamotoi]ATQ16481.1 DUF228 domain-containing protein [Borrelia miyamotoi]ATQ17629.1 DUF228 domain-containing protein [Borrelia miyamotoi]ATQ18921.1 DUF228 domain-containing protein [Borrelia miyamotoi]